MTQRETEGLPPYVNSDHARLRQGPTNHKKWTMREMDEPPQQCSMPSPTWTPLRPAIVFSGNPARPDQ